MGLLEAASAQQDRISALICLGAVLTWCYITRDINIRDTVTAPDLGQPLPRPQALEQLRGGGEGGVRQLAQAEHLPHRHAEAPHVGLGAVHLHGDGRRQ